MRQQADRLKNQGNDFVKQEKYKEALDAYNAAIQIDSNNSIYYCNRLVHKKSKKTLEFYIEKIVFVTICILVLLLIIN
jgi:tetratricopeptide (TPR) repeat protein